MNRAELAETALVGWRGQVAERVTEPLADRTRLSPDQVRAILAAGFFALSAYYVAGTVVRAVKRDG